MSRSLGRRARQKANSVASSPQGEGEAAYKAGVPITACPYYGSGRGKRHAWERGWKRARQFQQQDTTR
jgi:hypothetical protein